MEAFAQLLFLAAEVKTLRLIVYCLWCKEVTFCSDHALHVHVNLAGWIPSALALRSVSSSEFLEIQVWWKSQCGCTCRSCFSFSIAVNHSFSQMMAAKNDAKLVLQGNQRKECGVILGDQFTAADWLSFHFETLDWQFSLIFYRSDQSQLSAIQFFQKLKTGTVSG